MNISVDGYLDPNGGINYTFGVGCQIGSDNCNIKLGASYTGNTKTDKLIANGIFGGIYILGGGFSVSATQLHDNFFEPITTKESLHINLGNDERNNVDLTLYKSTTSYGKTGVLSEKIGTSLSVNLLGHGFTIDANRPMVENSDLKIDVTGKLSLVQAKWTNVNLHLTNMSFDYHPDIGIRPRKTFESVQSGMGFSQRII